MERYGAVRRSPYIRAAQGRSMLVCMADDHGISPIDPTKAAYVYAQLADHLAARIKAGDLRPGARLTGERELAQEYGVAVGTARRAIQELRERGVVVTLPAKGTFVVDPPFASDEEPPSPGD